MYMHNYVSSVLILNNLGPLDSGIWLRMAWDDYGQRSVVFHRHLGASRVEWAIMLTTLTHSHTDSIGWHNHRPMQITRWVKWLWDRLVNLAWLYRHGRSNVRNLKWYLHLQSTVQWCLSNVGLNNRLNNVNRHNHSLMSSSGMFSCRNQTCWILVNCNSGCTMMLTLL